MVKPQLTEILTKGHYVTAEDIKKAVEWAKSNEGGIEAYFLSQGLLTRELLGQAVAESYKLPYADLILRPPTPETVLLIPEKTAREFTCVAFHSDDEVNVATDNPENEKLIPALTELFPGKKIKLAYAPKSEIEPLFSNYAEPLVLRIIEEIGKSGQAAPEIVRQIFEEALTRHASDIHFEPQEDEVLVRFRIDGVLYIVGRFPKLTYENILNRIKVSAKLRIDEHQAVQDGAIRFHKGNEVIDFRVSIVPTLDGETVVLRILSSYVTELTLSGLGLSDDQQKQLVEASKKPFGMILVTGPTGSGKTTTLYALIKILNHPEINIDTIEDPVEYKISRVNQIQVNPATELTFAKGLKSIIRQDPNVILVGEIRDLETAEIAVNAALTGQLLFSTFHANDASSSVPRLLTLGIEPFMLASTLELLIAQRLVRKLCTNCRYSFKTTTASAYFPKGTTLYKGKGCEYCHHTGYRGRTAIFEILQMTEEMHDLILKNPSSEEIRRLAIRQGMETLFEDGLLKVKQGETTLEEVVRVAVDYGSKGKRK